jgi:hypothetical protein
MTKLWWHNISGLSIILGLAQNTIITVVFKYFKLTLCELGTTQYEKSWKNNRIYVQVYQQLRTKLYTGRFSKNVSIVGVDNNGHCGIKRLYEHMYNMYPFKLDNSDWQPRPWETPSERTIISPRLDSLEHEQALIALHKRTFYYTRACPNPCIQVHTLMPFAVRRLRFYRNTSAPTLRYKWARHSKCVA